MDPFYFFIGGFVIALALFKRELLIEKRGLRIILGISIAMFITGVVFHLTDTGTYSASGSFISPLISLGLFRLCRKVFLKQFKNEPKDTFLNWQTGMAQDRLFNVVYFVLASLLWMVAPFVMQQLAKAGW